MDQLLRWLVQSVLSSQAKASKLAENWGWFLIGLVVLVVII